MDCPNCGNELRTRKSLRRGKSAQPDECPDCGETIEKDDRPTRLRK